MRLNHFIGLLFLAACFNVASGVASVAKAQASSGPEPKAKNWVLVSWSKDSSTIANPKEISRSAGGNLFVVSVVYDPSYDPRNRLRGSYMMYRDEMNCQSKSVALREAQLYSLLGTAVGQRTQHFEPLSQSFPETVSRREIENVCRLAQLGPNKDDLTFESIMDFIRAAERVYPPRGPVPSKATPKSKPKPR
jgi:hypothetical protein